MKIIRVRVGTKTQTIYLDQGKIRRIRGVAYSTRVSPQTPGRIVESARGILNQFLPDIFIFADVAKGQSCGKSPGYGCTLVAESTNENVRISAEIMSNTKGEKQISAEELGQQAALRLLEVCTLPLNHFIFLIIRFEELNVSGVCDSVSQPLLILLSALNQADVSKILTGMLTAYSIELLRNMKLFLGVSFRLELIKGIVFSKSRILFRLFS